MRVNSIKPNGNRCFLSITFCSEVEERLFLQHLLACFGKNLAVNCMLTDLDTSYSAYKQYFPRDNYFVVEHITSVSIIAFSLDFSEVQSVISNWGYYTFNAIIAFGDFGSELTNQKLDHSHELKSLPIVVSQVLDTSLEIDLEHRYFEEILELLRID